MGKKMNRRSLALFVALALSSGGGALISPQTTFAAEVTISDPSDARLNQAELAGGASTGPGDNTPIVGNVLTFKNVSFMGTGYYTGIGYGGRNFAGTVVERNRIHVDGAQVKIAVGGSGLNGAVRDNTALVYNLSMVQTAKGGEARGSGQENTASGNHLGVVSSVVQSGYGGLSSYGTAEKNTVEISGGAFMQNVYGGSGDFGSPLATIRENSVTIENATFQDLGAQFPWSGDHTKEIAGGVVQSTVGGIGSTISENSVTIKSGTISVPVYGGKSYNGATVTKNKVVLTGGTYTDLIYGGDAHTEASENEVHLTNVTVPAVFGGSAAIANNNKIYLNGGVTVAQSIVGGDGTTSTGNTLTVKGVNTVQDRIKEVQKYAFDIAGVASTANPLLTVGGAVQTDMDWTQLSVTGTPAVSLLNQTITLMRQSGSDIAFGLTYNGKKVATDDGVEHIVDTDTQASTAHEITSTSYAFKGQTAPSQIGTDTWGGRSVGGNSTRENTIELSSGTHTDVYGGWTTGTGTTAEDKDASYKNIVTVKSGVTVTGDVYGGSAANGAAHDNTVHIDGTTIGGAVIGGRGSTATNNTVQLTNAAVGGTVTGGMVGTAAGGTDNTLRVKGNSTAAQMNGFQKFHFDLAGASTATPMLGITGTARTWLDWAQLTTDGSGAGVTLLSNPHGLDVANYTGAITTTTDTTERNIDTDTHSDTNVTSIRAESYQFAGVTAPVTLTGDVNGYGGISRAGNSTRNNAVELTSGNYADFYGGHTSGAGTTQTDKNDSHDNTVTVKSGVTVTNVYGGFAANGAATKNTVHIDGAHVAGRVVGGRGTTANDNTVQLTNASIGGVVVGGLASEANGASGNTLVVKGNSTAAQMNGFQKYRFDLTGANAATPMLSIASGGGTGIDWAQLSVEGSGTGITLLHNAGGLVLANYTGAITTTTDTTERNIDTDTHSDTNVTSIRAESYQFAGVTAPVTLTGDANGYGGISRAGNSTRNNAVELTSGNYADFYGGHTSGAGTTQTDKNDSHDNTVTVKSGVTVTNVYGGFAANGAATKNTVHIDGGSPLGDVIGGRGSTATNNTVQLTNAAVGGTVTGGMVGTTAGGTDNTLRVKGNSTAAQMNGFQKFHFDLAGANTATPMLGITGTARTWLNWAQLTTDGSGAGVTLLSNPHGLDVANYTGAITTTTDTTERNIDTDTHSDTGVTSIRAESYQFAGVTAPVTLTGDANGYGGISRAGNSTRNNAVELTSGNYADFYGGHTSGAGTTQTDKNDSHDNTVTVKSGVTVTNVYGGFAANGAATKNTVHIDGGSPLGDVIGGRGSTATNNTVTVTSGSAAAVVGGQSTGDATGNVVTLGGNFTGNLTGAVSTTGAASHNTLDLGTFDLAGNVTGGSGTAAAGNVIALRGTHVTGTVTGGRVGGTAGGVNNTLAVYYNAARSSEIGDFAGVQNLHFYLGDAAANTAPTLLKLTNAGGDKDVSGLKIRVGRSGAAAKLQKGDTFTLMENAAGNITGDAARVTGEGMDGVSRLYRFAVAPDAANRNKLIATVTSVGFAEQAKSFVETRAGAAAFLGSGGDFLVETALPSAQKEAARQGAADGGSYALWAGMGGNAMKYKTGSHVDMKGWSLGVGWARPLAVAEGTLTFGPFVEYGRGSYDSYLDDGTHADGTASYLGLGVMAKLKTTDGTWAEASMRLGRTKSDYAGVLDGTAASYDSASSYYAGHLGIGKELRLREKDTLNVYLRYFHAHTGAADETISTGERYHFDAVNSHRTRLGLRWTQELKDAAQLYAGLAWEYEFGGDARASYDGEGTPTPTLKGSSALLELGYRFAPKASRVSYDLHLTGWQGKRQGVTGGASVNWMF